MVKKYVLTGSAFSGKTTLINLLHQDNFPVCPEACTILIQEAQETGGAVPWEDLPAVLDILLDKQLKLEKQVDQCQVAFLDRGVPDLFAYFKLINKSPPQKFVEAFKHPYEKVFLLETLPGYKKDEIRREDPETVKKLRGLHEECYRELGYDVILVPVMPKLERKNYILDRI
tara:strand:+ start:116 stop:631 length:516 start_codon:yes stop_codon:yes gene_type:complete